MMSRSAMAFTLCAAVSTASAATLDCTPQNQNTITAGVLTPTITFTCFGTSAAPGNVITAVSLNLFVSFNDAVFPGGNHQIQSIGTIDSLEILGPATTTVTTSSGPFIGFGATTGYYGGTFALGSASVAGLPSLASFTISVESSSLGQSLPNNASISVAYATTEAPTETPGVPEPGSLLLLGSGFLGLGLSSRVHERVRGRLK